MNKKQAANISDDEIRKLMDFEGLAQHAGHMSLWDWISSNIKTITGSIGAVSVAALMVWVGVKDQAPVPDQSSGYEQLSAQPPAEKTPAIDSGIQQREIPVQTLQPMKVQPKKRAVVVQEKTQPTETAPSTNRTAVYMVYKEAEPVNGFPHLYEYFGTELKYPEEAIADSIQGIVTVTFMITRKGEIDKINILNSLGPAFDAEAIRLIKNMPGWRPATIDGQPIPSKFSIPLNFHFERIQK